VKDPDWNPEALGDYKAKLKNPQWQRVRLRILERDDFSCVFCGDGTITLHVHHFAYWDEPWKTPWRDLATLCENCHERLHKINNQDDFRREESEIRTSFMEKLTAMTEARIAFINNLELKELQSENRLLRDTSEYLKTQYINALEKLNEFRRNELAKPKV
jgi:hypothetical protein